MSTEIDDLSKVSPQCTFLESHPQPPKADSTLYLTRSATDNISGGQDHTIVGVHIVLAAGNTNGLWETFHIDREAQKLNATTQKKDPTRFLMATRSLTICCDTLEVHGEFCVPEADVTIYARHLVWASEDAAINTSPLLWDLPKATSAQGATPGADGANGRNAGSVKVFVSVLEPSGHKQARLVASGGRGQDPGDGHGGAAGENRTAMSQASFSGPFLAPLTSTTINFPIPAVYVDAEWYAVGLISVKADPKGVNSFPTSGGPAVAPGTPGDGGNGGVLTSNSKDLVVSFKNDAGEAGTTAKDCAGGGAGTPIQSAMYKLDIYLVSAEPYIGNLKASPTLTKTKEFQTKKGADVTAKPALKGTGSRLESIQIDCDNAWLHPLGLQAVLGFARDLFLAAARADVQQLLQDYEAGVALPMPQSMEGWKDCPWDDSTLAQWTAAQTEVASMLNRLRGHLDYFGNPAGYTPLLSLQGSIKLYQGETQRALRTMLLVDWVNAETSNTQEAADMLGGLIDAMKDDSARAADQVSAAERALQALNSRLDDLSQKLTDRGNELAAKQTELLGQAATTLEQRALIKGSIKMAGAICQVIPVGQPALGAVGSLAGVAADLIGSDPQGAADTVSKMGPVIAKAREAAKKADEASKKASDANKAGSAKPTDPGAAKQGASMIGTALDGLGPAFSQASSAIAALQVPQSAVKAELQRLESACPELQQLLSDISDLNDLKTDLFGELTDALQSLSDGYSRLSSNAGAIVSMQQQKGKQLDRIDHQASLFVQQVGQRSRLTLLKYLYFMVKAYETTMLQPLDNVDWALTGVTAKINDLLKGTKSFDGATLETKAQTLDPIFQDNINVVREKLLDDASKFNEVTMPRTLVLSSTQSPDDVDALNTTGRVVIDPFAYGLIDPKTQLARLSDADLDPPTFDVSGPVLPDGCQLIVDLIPAPVGTLRRDGSLCAIYSGSPVRWSWISSGDRLVKSLPSKGAEDVLDFILGPDSDKVRQKIARPPFWSCLDVRVRYSCALQDDEKPRIVRLLFTLSSDVTPAPDGQRVLMVHPIGVSPGAVVDCSPDLAGRQAGLGHFMRIYNQGASVQLSVPAAAFGADFKDWQLLPSSDRISTPGTQVKLKDDVTAQCSWGLNRNQVARFELTSQELAKLSETHPSEDVRSSLHVLLAQRPTDAQVAPPVAKLIRVAPDDEASVVGCVPPEGTPDLLQEGKDGWREVNYRGVAGWVKSS